MSEEMEITLVSEPLRVPARKKTSSARTLTEMRLAASRRPISGRAPTNIAPESTSVTAFTTQARSIRSWDARRSSSR